MRDGDDLDLENESIARQVIWRDEDNYVQSSLIIFPNAEPGVQYTFTLSAVDADFPSIAGFASTRIQVNSPPAFGSVEVSWLRALH